MLLVFLLSIPGYHGSGDTIPNEILPITIINEQNLDFDEFLEDPRYDFSEMPHFNGLPYFFSRVKERIVSNYPIIPGILNLPVFFAANYFGLDLHKNRFYLSKITSVSISLVSIAFIYLCMRILCVNKNTAISFSLIYALGTGVWSVASRAIWQHGPSVMFLSIALFFILNKKGESISYSGFFLGMAVFNRPTNALIAVTLTVYVFFHHRKHFIKFGLLAGIPALFLCLYSLAYWGSIFALGQGQGHKFFLIGKLT